MRLPIAILGVPFDPLTMDEALARMEQMIRSGRSHHVVTANVDFLVQSRRDPRLRRILREADMVLCDGTPLVWASGWLGNRLPARVAGADLVPLLVGRAAEQGFRLYFLGGSPEANLKAVANLRARHPRVEIVGHHAPAFKPLAEMDHEDLILRIRKARPDILFISFGCPKAEKWIDMHRGALDVPVMMGVGATIDFLAGNVRRAPGWMQRSGLEWFFRILQEPRRLLGRYVEDLRYFGWDLARQWWRLQFCRDKGRRRFPEWRATITQAWQRLETSGCLDRENIGMHLRFWELAGREDRHCLLDFSRVRFIDSTGLAVLVRLRRQLLSRGRLLVLLAPGSNVRAALKRARLDDCFLTAEDALEARRIILLEEEELMRMVADAPVYSHAALSATAEPPFTDALMADFQDGGPRVSGGVEPDARGRHAMAGAVAAQRLAVDARPDARP